MKKVFSGSIFLISLFTALINSACGDKCKPCNTGAECINGTCVCESGRLSFNGSCVQLGDNSYVGINPSCYCYDTLAISIAGQGVNRSVKIPIKYGDQVGSLSQNVFYYELSNGDSLYSPELDLRCFDANDTPLKPAAYGKKQADGSWKLRLEFHNALTLEVVDNCTVLLKKFQ